MGNAEGSKRLDPAETTGTTSEPGTTVAGTTTGAGQPAGGRPRTPAEERAEEALQSDDPDVLADSIEQTREELAETLDAIADRVSPKKVKERTTAMVKGAVKTHAGDAKETARNAAEQLKESAGATAASVRGTAAGAVETVKEKVSSDDGGSVPVGTPISAPPAPATPGQLRTPAPLEPPTDGMRTHTISTPGLNPEAKAAAIGVVAVVLLWLLRRRR